MGVLDMLNPSMVLKLRLIIYGVLIFFSFFIFVGTAVMKDKADSLFHSGSCPLYVDKHGAAGSDANCGYPMAMAIMFQLMYLLFRMVTLVLVMLGKFTPDMVLFSDLAELIYVIADLVAGFLIFIAACILSAGTNVTCDNWSYACDHTDKMKDALSASRAAQAGAWISTFLWIFIGICGFITLWRAGKIPFLSGGAAAKSEEGPGPADPNQPPIETPPSYNPDEPPKY